MSEYKREFNYDIVSTTTDDASDMVKFGHLIKLLHGHNICYAHAIHLAVGDVLCVKPIEVLEQNNFEINDSEDGSEEFNQGEELGYIEFENSSVDAVVIKDYFSILKKVHTIINCLKKSPVKNNDMLQKHVKSEFGHELKPFLGCKTCWNSLFDMVEHFVKLSKCIKMAVIQVQSPINNIRFRAASS